jgi:hypothetical protein
VSFSVASFRDPENFAVSIDGAWFRIANQASAKALRILNERPLKNELVTRGSLVDFGEVEPANAQAILERVEESAHRSLPQNAAVFWVESVDPISYPWEWPNRLLASAAECTLDIRDRLLEIGLDLKDASATNIQFLGTRPFLVDIGSIERWRPNPSWNASRQFIEHFINPLAVGSSEHVSSADAWRISNYRGLRTDAARELMSAKLRRRPALSLLQATTRPVKANKPSETRFADQARENPDLALKATRSLTRKLRRAVANLDSGVHATTWADYGSRDHYNSEALEKKYELTRQFIARDEERSHLVLDIGGNDGLIGERLARNLNARVIVMDADSGALDALAAKLGNTSTEVTPWVGDMTNPFPASGLLGHEFASIHQRVMPTAVLSQAVLHHIVITQGVPMQLAVDALASFGAPIQIEFAEPEDEKVKLLLSQIPNWSGDYSTEVLLEALRTRYLTVEIDGSTSPTRVMVSAETLR